MDFAAATRAAAGSSVLDFVVTGGVEGVVADGVGMVVVVFVAVVVVGCEGDEDSYDYIDSGAALVVAAAAAAPVAAAAAGIAVPGDSRIPDALPRV